MGKPVPWIRLVTSDVCSSGQKTQWPKLKEGEPGGQHLERKQSELTEILPDQTARANMGRKHAEPQPLGNLPQGQHIQRLAPGTP